MRISIGIVCAMFMFMLCGPQVKADTCSGGGNLLANCGFETGDFTGWTLSGNDVPGQENNLYGVESGVDPVLGIGPNSGSFQTFIGDLNANPLTLSQTLATNIGEQYVVTFFLAQGLAGPGPSSNFLNVFFGGGEGSLTNVADIGYTEFIGTFTATSGSTLFSIEAGNDTGFFLLDDVAVQGVPEPSSSTLMLLGVGLIALVSLKKRVSVTN